MKPEATKDDTPKLRIHSFPRPRRIRYGTTVVTRAMSITCPTKSNIYSETTTLDVEFKKIRQQREKAIQSG